MEKENNNFNFEDLLSHLVVEPITKEILVEKNTIDKLNELEQINKKDIDYTNRMIKLMFLDSEYLKGKNYSLIAKKEIDLKRSVDKLNRVISFINIIFIIAFILSFFIFQGFIWFTFNAILLCFNLILKNYQLYKNEQLDNEKKELRIKEGKYLYDKITAMKDKKFPLVHLVFNALKTKNREENQLIKSKLIKVYKKLEKQMKFQEYLSKSLKWDNKYSWDDIQMLSLEEIVNAKKENNQLNHILDYLFKTIMEELNGKRKN